MKNGKPKVESGIPIPEETRGRKGVIAPLMRSMKKGDSILLHSSVSSARNNATNYIGRGKYTLRADGKGFRVWRIA